MLERMPRTLKAACVAVALIATGCAEANQGKANDAQPTAPKNVATGDGYSVIGYTEAQRSIAQQNTEEMAQALNIPVDIVHTSEYKGRNTVRVDLDGSMSARVPEGVIVKNREWEGGENGVWVNRYRQEGERVLFSQNSPFVWRKVNGSDNS